MARRARTVGVAKSADAFRTISEVADELDVQKHVLRFWEVKFPQLKPMKRGGGRRYYRPEDLQLLYGIRHLLHGEGYTIRGVQKILRDQSLESVKALGQSVIDQGDGAVAMADVPVGRNTRPKRGAKRAKAPSPALRLPMGDPANAVRREAIMLAIKELEVCRAILRGELAGGDRAKLSQTGK